MFVTDDTALVRNFYFHNRIRFQDNALACETRFEAWICSTVNKIFFFFAYFFEKIIARFDVNVASGTGTDAADTSSQGLALA